MNYLAKEEASAFATPVPRWLHHSEQYLLSNLLSVTLLTKQYLQKFFFNLMFKKTSVNKFDTKRQLLDKKIAIMQRKLIILTPVAGSKNLLWGRTLGSPDLMITAAK